jgi:hypothetical protein
MAAEQDDTMRDLIALLRAIEWDPLVRKLLAYASFRISRFGGAAYLRQKIEDYVQEAVKLMLDGTRHFEFNEQALFAFLCGVVDSLVSHDAEKARRRGTHLSIIAAPSNDDAKGETYEDRIASAADIEGDVVLRDQLDTFVTSLPDGRIRTYTRMRASESCATAEEYASAMNTTVEEVRNMDRRLRRRRVRW